MDLHVAAPGEPAVINEDASPAELIEWSLQRFADQRLALTTSFGMEGCALIDMYARPGRPVTVIYLDTMFFFPETYALRDEMAARYPNIRFENRGTTLTPQEQEQRFGPELWKREPNQCCKLRKVDPMREALADVDVWVTALRRSQSRTRSDIPVIGWDWQHQLLKICPLARWERSDVWDYIQQNNVPYNKLHEQGYPSIGCTHCTQPVADSVIGQYSRAGRWVEHQKTECGLHGDGI